MTGNKNKNYKNKIGEIKLSGDSWKKAMFGNDDSEWTRTLDKIFLEPNGRNVREIESILNELIGPIGEEWRFLSLNPRILVHPDISVKKTRREEIIEILESNNLLMLPWSSKRL